eukprot:756632-Hanusia_phi.AAC.2
MMSGDSEVRSGSRKKWNSVGRGRRARNAGSSLRRGAERRERREGARGVGEERRSRTVSFAAESKRMSEERYLITRRGLTAIGARGGRRVKMLFRNRVGKYFMKAKQGGRRRTKWRERQHRKELERRREEKRGGEESKAKQSKGGERRGGEGRGETTRGVSGEKVSCG